MASGTRSAAGESVAGEVRQPSPPRDEPGALPVGTEVGRYLVTGTLGAGGQSFVLAAYDPQLNRRVAIKVLRGAGDARLLREANALARVIHPNVVVVHDVGVVGGRVYLVQEYLDGGTLDDWLRAAPRGWREVVSVFTRAGAGLAAAHAAGLVHRDFKLANVLRGLDGRIRVLDFGLARAAHGGESEPAEPLDASPPLSTELTQAGAVMGTPGYMSPEQRRGEPADARSDQYSFCVALHEALLGERPHTEGSVGEGRLPGWLRRLLARGLAPSPAARYPSMNALLVDLGRDRRRTLRRAVVAGLMVALAGGAVWAVSARPDPAARCVASWVAEVWDAPRRAAVERAFLASGVPSAERLWRQTAALLDERTAELQASHAGACRETHERGQQSPEMFDRQLACLSRRQQETVAIVDVLTRADAAAATRALLAIRSLPPVATCADRAALLAPILPPPPRQVEAVAGTRLLLDRARALQATGKPLPGIAAATLALTGARALGYAPLLGETLYRIANIRDELVDWRRAAPAATEAAAAAYEGGDDRLAAMAYILLVKISGVDGRRDESRQAARFAAAAIQRAGGEVMLEAHLENNLGIVADVNREQTQAMAHASRAALLYRQAGAPDVEITRAENNLGLYLNHSGKFAEAQPYLERAAAAYERLLGPAHPRTANTLGNLGRNLNDRRRYAEAEAVLRRAAAAFDAIGNSEQGAAMRGNLAWSLQLLRRFDESLAVHEQVVRDETAAFGAEDRRTLYSRLARAIALRNLDRLDEAAVDEEAARAVWARDPDANAVHLAYAERELGETRLLQHRLPEALALVLNAKERLVALDADEIEMGKIWWSVADVQRASGHRAAARTAYEQAIRFTTHAYGPAGLELTQPLRCLGEILLEEGAPARARPLLEQSLALALAGAPWSHPAETQLALARCLWELGEDRPRALALAEAVRADPGGSKALLGDAERWLNARR